jgi:hypothetical protein
VDGTEAPQRALMSTQSQVAIYSDFCFNSLSIHGYTRRAKEHNPLPLYVYFFPFSLPSWYKPRIYPCSEQPGWRALPPEIVHIIMEMLGSDRATLRACALAFREFTFAASCRLGRHISINAVRRLRECASLLTGGSAFQHVRSLDLGITARKAIHRKYWDDYLTILDVFARRRSLTRLWLSGVSFYFSGRGKQERARNAIISLTSTVNELGLYSCSFSSYPEMISLIRSFPLCTSLYVRDCFVRRTPGSNMFGDLPQHTLHISDLELTSSPCHKPPVDVSTLPEDAAIDLSPLTGFSCHMSTADQARHSIITAADSSVERLQLMCEEPEGFHGASQSSLFVNVQ